MRICSSGRGAGSSETRTSKRMVSETFRCDVRVTDLPAPRPDEQILFGDETFLIRGEPIRDRDRLIWTIEATPA